MRRDANPREAMRSRNSTNREPSFEPGILGTMPGVERVSCNGNALVVRGCVCVCAVRRPHGWMKKKKGCYYSNGWGERSASGEAQAIHGIGGCIIECSPRRDGPNTWQGRAFLPNQSLLGGPLTPYYN